MDHLFLECRGVARVSDLAAQHRWIPPQLLQQFSHDWLHSFGKFNKFCKVRELQKLSFLLWSVWKARNAVVFKNESFNPLRCTIRAKKASTEWNIRNCLSVDNFFTGRSFGHVHKHKIVHWQPPPPGSVKINFDGSVQHNSMAGGFIICDWHGMMLGTGAKHYGCTSTIVAEARTLRMVFKLLGQLDIWIFLQKGIIRLSSRR